MKKNLFFSLLIMTLVGCRTVKFSPPKEKKYLISVENNQVYCLEDDLNDNHGAYFVPIDACNNVIGVKPKYLDKLDAYYLDKLKRLEICLISREKCQ
jgi:hypothetical protein